MSDLMLGDVIVERDTIKAERDALAAQLAAITDFVEERAGADCHRYDKWLGGKTCLAQAEAQSPCESCRARKLMGVLAADPSPTVELYRAALAYAEARYAGAFTSDPTAGASVGTTFTAFLAARSKVNR